MSESTIVRTIIKAVKAKYPRAYVRKLSDRFTRGVPDILIVVHCSQAMGKWFYQDEFCGVLFVETKTKKGRLSKLQGIELASIQENGGEAIIARDADTVLAKLEAMGAVK
jgi:hypothetical protein